MVEDEVVESIRKYVVAARERGFNIKRVVLFGSFARGEQREHSDIDLVVVCPEFDDDHNDARISDLWSLRAQTDARIEPIPCGEREWVEDDERVVLEIARREGIVIEVAA